MTALNPARLQAIRQRTTRPGSRPPISPPPADVA